VTHWNNRHALVTGASSGAGFATAELLAAAGAHVTLLARDPDRLEIAREAVAAGRADSAQKIAARSCDVSDWEQVRDAVAWAEAGTGPIDTLAACAGFCTPGRFVELALEEFRTHVDVNLLGVIYATRAVVPGMIGRGRGHVGLVSSMGGLVGVYGYSAYSAAKFGVTGFAEVLRCELKPHGIGVTLLVPPNMDTPGYARELDLEPPETAAINGIAKTWPPKDVARLFVRGMERDRFLVLAGLTNKLLYRAEGLWPELFFALFDGKVAGVRKGAAAHGE
jgi:3-dehydrosphinganine reductase